jgi:hypothetical protein
MSRGGSHTRSYQHASHQLNDEHISLLNTVAPKKLITSSTCHLLQYSCQAFLLTKDNMDILNHFIDFMTSEMRWRMPLLSLTIELILHIPKLVFHWNVALMSHVQCFHDLLKYGRSISLKQCGHPQLTFLLYPNKLCVAGESQTVTNKMALS